ncbi:efflux RND transporter periplasmic adaptor subunit [Undibacterium sp. CY7W]|uniref:Efflux RND transporter periplasmic adaptor subunit n=1 Tax=Undibacterium rugosum TaxID=2762291 RepID=A0A923KTY3_9BURK|nr:efflux RND transporter periplasmic adaptor subunit [Undibacterium rugosum]MBC3936529.1 efflux RND transporter periplasmic adaptor subunit [Undibacterium rugosum]
MKGYAPLRLPIALALTAALGLGACSKAPEKVEVIRPVRVIVAGVSDSSASLELSGEVRPHIESRLGFRVPGKILARKVELGTAVKRGQVLMQLDPQDIALAQMQAKAALTSAESNRDLAAAELKRYQELRTKNFVAASVLGSKEVAYKAAQATFEQAQAAYKNQLNQSSYTSLVADIDGVVTALEAEIGQVVAAGTPVVRVAQSGAMDVVVGIPENAINAIKQFSDIQIRLWADSGKAIAGKIRELSPLADPATRTYLAKISLPADVQDVRLGMTATVSLRTGSERDVIRLPMTALFQEKGVSSVWVVQDGVAKLVPVQLGGTSGETVIIANGITKGQAVVTAGVNLLKPGQKVSILGAVAKPVNTVDAGAASAGVAK